MSRKTLFYVGSARRNIKKTDVFCYMWNLKTQTSRSKNIICLDNNEIGMIVVMIYMIFIEKEMLFNWDFQNVKFIIKWSSQRSFEKKTRHYQGTVSYFPYTVLIRNHTANKTLQLQRMSCAWTVEKKYRFLMFAWNSSSSLLLEMVRKSNFNQDIIGHVFIVTIKKITKIK
jgi:hypothetical protein